MIPFASAAFTVLSGVNVAVLPSGNVTVAAPFAPTSTFVAVGFAFLTAALTFSFSSFVNAARFLTGVFAGSLIPFASGTFVATTGLLESDIFPLLSVALTVTLPSGMLTSGIIVTLPAESAVPSPILLLFLSYKITFEPGSAVTSIGVLVNAFSVKSVVITGLF